MTDTKTKTPKNLAELKRLLKVGARVRAVWRHYQGDVNELCTVTRVQRDGVYFAATPPKTEEPFARFFKAGCYDFNDEGYTVYVVDDLGRKPLARYEWVK